MRRCRRWIWMLALALAAVLLLVWHRVWFAAGFVAGYGWTIAVIAASSARAGYRAARGGRSDGASHLD